MDILQKEHYCYMNKSPSSVTTDRQVSANGLLYNYTIQDVQLSNALGAVIARLIEYKLSGSAVDTISLYRTSEGNYMI